MDKVIRIANGQGFWGDSILAPVRLVREGPIDYLTLDYLAEVTMSIMQKLKHRDPSRGYATDFIQLLDRILPEIIEKNIKIVANAGGVNARGCAEAIAELARSKGIYDLKLGTVTGDDIYPDLDRLIEQGEQFTNMETGATIHTIRDDLTSANAYIGAFPIAEALAQGAQIVVTGRCTDPSLVLGPMIHEFGWETADYDKLASGTIAGHIIECGAQCTGGIYTDWRNVDDLALIGYPIVEVDASGDFSVTKHEGSGGIVDVQSIASQLVYEIEDPQQYYTPDVIADFTSVDLHLEHQDRVKVTSISGEAPTDTLKVSMSYSSGWKAVGQLTVAGPDAVDKAKLSAEIIWKRLQYDGVTFAEEDIDVEILGSGVLQPHPKKIDFQPGEVVLRIGVRDQSKRKIERFGMEIVPLVTSGPPGITGYGAGRPKPSEIISYWPTLIGKEKITPDVQILTI